MSMSNPEYETLKSIWVSLVDCPKTETRVDTENICKKCRFFVKYTSHSDVVCSYRSNKF